MSDHKEELVGLVRDFPNAKVLVVGDPMIDIYHFGQVTKLSQEAPVPVFVQLHVGRREGGALNVARNLRELGVQTHAFTPSQPWTEKHRFLVGHQQIFREDKDIEHQPLALNTDLRELMAWCDIVILSDYGKGSLQYDFCQEFIGAMQATKPVIVDPRGGDWDKYVGATAICPNEHEWAEHMGQRTRTELRPVFPYTLLKLGASGMQLGSMDVRTSADILWRSHTRARQVFDVTGAGDTVIATFAAALARAANTYVPESEAGTKPICLAAELANMAAGVVVGKVGTATCSREELLQEIDRG